MTSSRYSSTIIISVYKDDEALSLILAALRRQSVDDFEILVSEDGESEEIAGLLERHGDPAIVHLTQHDDGFRKNIALNRAAQAASARHLVFIDGDCVPHPHFIEAHRNAVANSAVTTGRRVELGQNISAQLRSGQMSLASITGFTSYLLNARRLLTDKVKNIESGLYLPLLSGLLLDRPIRMLGCNFSCMRDDLLKINGFNEDYLSPGIGEDSDIDWRFTQAGVRIRNVKFSAIQYHLHHPRAYTVSQRNQQLFEATRAAGDYRCRNGIVKLPS